MRQSHFDEAMAAGVDALYELQGVPATYTPNGGSPSTVSILVDDRSRENMDKAASRSRVHVLRGSLRVSEVETLARGDTIQLSDEQVVFRIVPNSLNCDGLEWDFEATADVATTVGAVRTFPDR